MHYLDYQNKSPILLSAVLTVLIVGALFLWQGSTGFNLWDEGFLWYGVQRVMSGEVPILDFMAYDPGRYYWSAAIMTLWDSTGIMALRASVAVFQATGLFTALLLISQTAKKQRFLYLLLSGLTLAAWMFPRHKLFDITLSIFMVGVLTLLVQNPDRKRYFFSGVCVGLVAVFGRNHGMYGAVASIGVILWLNCKQTQAVGLLKGFGFWAVGVIAGFLPILMMAALIPGFGVAFLESIHLMFEVEYYFSLPVPWPWRVNFSQPLAWVIRNILIGLFFIGTVGFGVATTCWALWRKFQHKDTPPVLVATSFLALTYAHHAFYWPDVAHLAQSIFPLLIGCLVLFSTQTNRAMWTLAIVLCAASLWIMVIYHPGWQCRAGKQYTNIEISGSNLWVDHQTEKEVKLLRQLSSQYAANGQSFIAAPFWPGAYALVEAKSPMWDIYPLLPRSQVFENAEIDRIKASNPGFAIILDKPLIGRDELRFSNTHPLTYRYILAHFDRQPDVLGPDYQIYKTK